MIKSWKTKLKNGWKIGVIIKDVSKAFDSLNHDFLLTKLDAYGLDNNAVSLMRSYLTNRPQRFKTNNSFNEWVKISAGVLQGSMLGALLFINDTFLFLQKCDLANYADDSTVYATDKRVTIIDSTSHDFTILSKRFYNNVMVLIPDKCSFMFLGVANSLQTNLVCGDKILKNTKRKNC